MALPRPTLLAVAGAILSLVSFTAMRTIATQSTGDLPVPDVATPVPERVAPDPVAPVLTTVTVCHW